MYSSAILKTKAEDKIMTPYDGGAIQVLHDGATLEAGKAGCEILVKLKPVEVWEHSYQMLDSVSFTLAELGAILLRLRDIESWDGNINFFVDTCSEIESFMSRHLM